MGGSASASENMDIEANVTGPLKISPGLQGQGVGERCQQNVFRPPCSPFLTGIHPWGTPSHAVMTPHYLLPTRSQVLWSLKSKQFGEPLRKMNINLLMQKADTRTKPDIYLEVRAT